MRWPPCEPLVVGGLALLCCVSAALGLRLALTLAEQRLAPMESEEEKRVERQREASLAGLLFTVAPVYS